MKIAECALPCPPLTDQEVSGLPSMAAAAPPGFEANDWAADWKWTGSPSALAVSSLNSKSPNGPS